MADNQRIVIIGAGPTGARTAEHLRGEGWAGPITMVGDEAHLPYERPPLSKGYLVGSTERADLTMHPAGWYEDNDIDVITSRTVTDVDISAHRVVLEGGSSLPFDRLLLSTGAIPRRLDIPGSDLSGVHYLRRLDDADRLSAAFDDSSRVVVIGGGWIGLETAAAARTRGLEVVLLESAPLPLGAVLGTKVASTIASLHLDHGVDLRTEVQVDALLGTEGSVTHVRLASGEVIPTDLVIVGIGVDPADQLARRAGLDVDDGVVTDAHLRTSHPDVFAAGDVASAFHPILRRRVRVEHWENAMRQAPVAARGLLDLEASYDRLPFFYSDQYDMGLEYTGFVPPGEFDEVVVRGRLDNREFIAFWMSQGRVRAGMNMNVWGLAGTIESLILSGQAIEAYLLADEGTKLDELLES